MPVAETLKRIDGMLVGSTVDRTGLGAAQTPQGARRDLLRARLPPLPADGPETFTDEASLLEACRVAVHVVAGDPANIKVTLPADLEPGQERRWAVGAPRAPGSATTAIRSVRAARSGFGGIEIPAAPAPGRTLGR